MSLSFLTSGRLNATVDSVVKELVTCGRFEGETFVNLPILFPSGSSVTVKITGSDPSYQISDNGFAFRELESIGIERSFGRTASWVATDIGIERNARAFFTKCDLSGLFRAICDVSAASWRTVDRVYARLSDVDEAEIAEGLYERLVHIFGTDQVKHGTLSGASTTEWEMHAVVNVGTQRTVFQAVSENANSVFRTNSAFHDLASLDSPPNLIAVVHDKAALGSRLALLAQVGHIIQQDQPDEVFMRVAA